jgi:hypothetical protein
MRFTSPHQQQGYCALCADDAAAHNHCSWCGTTFGNQDALADHLDKCLPGMLSDLGME